MSTEKCKSTLDGDDDKPDEIFPDGGTRAWLVAIGSGGLTFCTLGYINAFGYAHVLDFLRLPLPPLTKLHSIFQSYYETHQLSHKSPSDIAWVGSLQVFLLFASTLFGGPLFDRFGSIVIWPSAVLFVSSIMITSLCTEYYQFMLAQALLGGSSIGMVMTPGLAAVGQYFKKRRAAAMSITVAGSSLGGVIFPIMLDSMLANPQLGFGWAVRICGFLAMAILVPSCIAVRARLRPRKHQFLLPSAFKDPIYIMIIAAGALLLIGFFIPSFFLANFAIVNGTDAKLAFYLVAIFNGASFFGRILSGLLADRFGCFNVYLLAAASTTMLSFCWQAMRSTAAVTVFAVLYGFVSGAIVSMFATTLATAAPDPYRIGTYIGMGMAVASVSVLISPPIGGAILAARGFGPVANFSGAACTVGSILVILIKLKSHRGVLSLY